MGNRSPELIFCLCLYYLLVPMVRQHDQGNLFFKMFNLGLRFQRVRVHDVRAKAQLRAHILPCKRKAETQRDTQTDKDEIMKETQTERERAHWKWLKSLKLQSTPPVTTFPNEATPPNPSQIVLPTGDQVFKHYERHSTPCFSQAMAT